MLGEASGIISDLRNEIAMLEEERDNYVLANEDNIPETIYNKKLAEYDKRIEELWDSLRRWNTEYRDIIDKHCR